MELSNSLNTVYLGNIQRLQSIAGVGAVDALSTSGLRFIRDLFIADVLIISRWWDPLVTLLKLVRPNITTVFVADGHFSTLNLNKRENKRHGKNIFEMMYCDIYLLPDALSLSAAARYPGLKFLYRPHYLEKPNLSFSNKPKKSYDIAFIYGNDPFFSALFREKLLTLINTIDASFKNRYSIAHIVPPNKNGKILSKSLPSSSNIYFGLNEGNHILSKNTTYLCTPSTIVWQLMAISGKVALIDIYKDDICFPSTIPRVSTAEDVETTVSKSRECSQRGLNVVEQVLCKAGMLSTINQALEQYMPIQRKKSWNSLTQHKLRDLFSSLKSVISRI